MAFEFDHLFICVDIGAAVAANLIDLGLVEGTANTHPGQGTANRRFFFHNAMLELLWVRDPAEATAPLTRLTYLWERWQNRHLECPFGICLRPATADSDHVAFPHWIYQPTYLPEALSIAMGTNSAMLGEPLLFQTPFGKRPDQYDPKQAQPLNHRTGWREITRVELISPTADSISPALAAVLATRQLRLRRGAAYRIELGFDRERQGQRIDCRPDLPLIFTW
ncbi:MAG: VOC family protein [Synechococcus sp.]|nr:VOC family protein [Synechococcus sp.]